MTSRDEEIRVLVVEDDDEVATRALAALDSPGYVAERIGGLTTLLAAAPDLDCDVVLLGGDLREFDGVSAVRLVVGTTDQPVVVLTHQDDEERTLEFLRAGAQQSVPATSFTRDGISLRRVLQNAVIRQGVDATRHLQATLNRWADAVIIVDTRHIIRSFNAAAEQLYRRHAVEVIGQPVSILATTADQLEKQAANVARILAGETLAPFESRRHLLDGTEIAVELAGSPVIGVGGAVVGACLIARDITATVTAREELIQQQERLARSQAAGQVGTWELDLATMHNEWSAENSRLHLFPDEPRTLPMADLLGYIHPDDRAKTAPPGPPAREFVNEYRVVRDPGNVRVLVNRGRWVPGPDGHPGYIVGTSHDVTEERAAQAARRRADEQFRRVFDDGLVAMAICDTSLRIVHVNEAFRRLTRMPREQLIGAYAGDFSRSEQAPEDFAAAIEALKQGTVFTEERRYVRPEGGLGWLEVVISPVDVDGEIVEYLAQVRDVTQRHQQNAELRHMAAHDPLTGVLNRRAFDEALRQHVAALRPGERCGTLLMIDLDNFKRHNDSYGHASGDTLLIGITQTVKRSLREHDLLGRLGGDEFVVLLPDTEVDEAELVATRLITEVREYAAATTPDDEHPVTASIGVVGLRPGHDDGSAFVLDADRALYEAKAQGRDRWVRVTG